MTPAPPTPLPMSAELKAHPTAELQEFIDTARAHSTASQSTVRKDFACKDGLLAVTSHNGGAVRYTLEPPPAVLPGE